MFTISLLPQVKSNRRDYVLIVSDILSCAVRGAKKTELMCKAGLSSAQLDKYMMLLFKTEMLERQHHKERFVYKTTMKGRDFLETFGELAKLLDGALSYEPTFQETESPSNDSLHESRLPRDSDRVEI
jgi:predicted transcriptional regulator